MIFLKNQLEISWLASFFRKSHFWDQNHDFWPSFVWSVSKYFSLEYPNKIGANLSWLRILFPLFLIINEKFQNRSVEWNLVCEHHFCNPANMGKFFVLAISRKPRWNISTANRDQNEYGLNKNPRTNNFQIMKLIFYYEMKS